MSDRISEPTSTQWLRRVCGGERDDPAEIDIKTSADRLREGD